ncbi:MAG: Nif11-like leader peptide family natural product precursor [Verrucomicrobia bacterium]|nr:Nif11-like leader peptide family natural product precursor [Verrucomicrobiota bacterium]
MNPQPGAFPAAPATPHGFAEFRQMVLADPALQGQLAGLAGHAAFVTRTVELGRDRGFAFHPADVEAALQAARRAWIERWIT